MKNSILFLIVFFFTLSIPSLAGNTGKIAGKIVDEKTGEPVVGANISIVGTTMGASANLDGEYTILNISPGTYTLRATAIGYRSTAVTSVRVNIDLTTKVNFKMKEEAIELKEEIVIIAERPAVRKDLTASTAIINSDQITALPVTELSEVLDLQAGYLGGHLRGGRSGEIAYWIDGVPVTDVYDGSAVIEVNKNLTQELQLVSGAFNAEYGQAMSGIVNIATKDGGAIYNGSISSYIGSYISKHSETFLDIDKIKPVAVRNFEASLSGPLVNNLSFFANGRFIHFGGWLNGVRQYNPQNIAYIDSAKNFIQFRDPSGKGDSAIVPMNSSEKIYAQGKLTYKLSPEIKLWYNFILDNVKYQDYNGFFRFNPDSNPTNYRNSYSHLAQATHLLSEKSFYTIGVTYFAKNFKRYVYEDMFDSRYVHPTLLQAITPYSASTGGVDVTHFERKTSSLIAKVDFTTQMTQRHLIKGGLEFRQHQLYFNNITLRPVESQSDINIGKDSPFIQTRVLDVSTVYHDEYTKKPREYAAYVQDKMEFEDLIINLGVRVDAFEPDGFILADPSDPSIYNPIKPQNRFHDLNGNGIQDADEPGVTFEERRSYWYKNATTKVQVSPRLGVSFPISDRGVIHFSYGHFFQVPRFEYLYENPFFKLGSGTGNQGRVGNSDLKPEQTINGEVGLQQRLSTDISMDITGYFRDIRNLTGTRSDEIIIFGGSATYSRYVNSDFAFIRGIALSLNKKFTEGLGATLNYTFQIAKGTGSDPTAAQQAAARGELPEVQLTPLDWDQRHSVNISVLYSASSWGASLVGQYGTGTPYTPRRSIDITSLITNSESKPSFLNADLRLYKNIMIGSSNVSLFLRVFNLFDTMNEFGVFDDTGRAGFTTDEARIKAQNTPEYVNTIKNYFLIPTQYSEPRRIEIGASFDF